MNKIKPQIKDDVADTLFIPLFMRSMETQHPKAIIHDAKAAELVNAGMGRSPAFNWV